MLIKGNLVVLEGGKSISPGYVVVEGENIVSVHNTLPTDSNLGEVHEADIVCAGFFDIHTHGIGGAEDMLEYWMHDLTLKKLPVYGCTSTLASVTFAKDSSLSKKVIEVVVSKTGKVIPGQTVLEGIHSEGPIVNDCGGLPHSHVDMGLEKFKQLLTLMGPALKIMTISPTAEAQINFERLKALLDHGGVPALGHDKNSAEKDILSALRICADYNVKPHITHVCNVTSFHHRIPSLVNFGMVEAYPDEEMYRGLPVPTIEIIGDLVHVCSLTITSFLSSRHPSNVAFITDAVFDSQSDREMMYAGQSMGVKDVYMGRKAVVLKGTDTIAGSCGNMLQIFNNLVKVLRVPVEKAVQMLSETPATIAKVNSKIGTITPGKRADILLINSDYQLKSTIIAGKVVYSST